MERVRKTFFNPLATSKAQVEKILEGLPVGSAHPFSLEQILLCRTENGIEEIDISSYPENFFFNAMDLGEMGEILLRRMAGFQSHLKVFEDFQITQAPSSTFKIPIVSDQITILAVSERTPTYYDFCFADESCNACCWLARNTFPGITHSGDILNGQDLLDYVKINKDSLIEKEICVFISGYQSTLITRFLGTHPALLVADHVDKVLYIIPVPLDAATIGDATICCPLVIKRDGDSLIYSILPTATTDRGMMCDSNKLVSPAFPEAIKRADFTMCTPDLTTRKTAPANDSVVEDTASNSENLRKIITKENAIFTTDSAALPSFIDLEKTQIIRFGTGLEFKLPDEEVPMREEPSAIVLPCIFGTELQGPVLLATGTVPSNVPFPNENALRDYYKQLKNAVVIVDERMTDNARNLASAYRINALFIVQLTPETEPKDTNGVISLMDLANINAVTALAGPQSLILVQISEKYYFYRGIANRAHLNTSGLAFGADVTSVLESVGIGSILDPRIERVINLGDANSIVLPTTGQLVQPQDLQKLFEEISVDQIQNLEEDISAVVPQLQVLLNQKDLQELSRALVTALSTKISNAATPLRDSYTKFLTQDYRMEDPKSVQKKNKMLGELRKITKDMQKALEPVISCLANMISSQTTSKRTHDLKRLVRQTTIQNNVEAVKSMTFETLSGYLEEYAGDMGVMLLNIETTPYRELLGNLKNSAIDASQCCALDSRILHLEGFDAGIIMEQSQTKHNGPLKSTIGPSQPILALPYLSQSSGTGSMLAWVLRWMEKCNEPHIAALRIIMRSTLGQAVASREHDIQPSSPETGHLMSALLMAAMSKLAAMRTSKPVELEKAEDTVTRLMRGLFGNLLTIAGSGIRPLSMVWQLFGLNPQYDLPTSSAEWIWYENVVALYPYTGWPLRQFHGNLEKLLDKAVIRVVTKNENLARIKASRTAEMVKFCKLRNIQLEHSRTIITVFMRMLTAEDIDLQPVAARLLAQLPHKLERQSQSYTRMIMYLNHLARGGERRVNDDLTAANVYTSRSATFAELKKQVCEACKRSDWARMKEACQEIMTKHVEIAALWRVKPESLKIQNMKLYKALLAADFDDIDQNTQIKNIELTRQVLGDAENKRVPWQVGKKGQFGSSIEPLDEVFLHEIMTGEKSEPAPPATIDDFKGEEERAMIETEDEFAEFESSLRAEFIKTMQKNLSAEEVCDIINVPVSAMRVFIKALNPEFIWEDLAVNFKSVILELVKDRSNRVESRPVRRLLRIEVRKNLQIEG
ncbi:uncharacterized protein NFIA_000660 [Aspergillus fischeri NRRL 181]|uniref:Uncharacterized protein n=1 Tax=Neosartorya fischeri (strain ATCC 1020 / DSM 3700 / CBS 544.65 / FGSC A1164 / JCM 1740 / NRRL 181 / WB 181) TaxID=331117 RepID=A1DJ33_NEOFI|nr:conserved hypothetical protein [Aspergillus fischeri NRRL 181]EAW16722.1 conserved hypothetical protein [Aspergillus fischeri NRRL 181]